MRPNQVRVHNPKSRNGYTSRKSALRYVTRGLARWRPDGAVEFIEAEDYRAASVAASITASRLQQIGYDQDVASGRMASLNAIKHLPVAGNVLRLLTRSVGASHRPQSGRSGPVRVISGAAVA